MSNLDKLQKKAKALYLGGMSVKKIASKLGVTAPVVSFLLKDAGVEVVASPPPLNHKLTQKQKDRILSWYEKVNDAEAVVKKTGFSITTVKKVLKDNGIDVPHKNVLHPVWEHQREITKRHLRGESFVTLGKEFGVSGTTVRNVFLNNRKG